MEWKEPKHEEVSLNCEISSYSDAELEPVSQHSSR